MEMAGNGSIVSQEPGKPNGKCRKWRLYVTTEAGRKSRRFTGTYSQAETALKAFRDEIAGSTGRDDTFDAYAAEWMAYRRSSGAVEASSSCNDRYHAAIVSRYVGGERMQDITPAMCRRALADMLVTYSGTYCNGIYTTWKSIMKAALRDGVVSRNPLEFVDAPRTDTKEKEWMPPAELAAFVRRVEAMPRDGRTMALLLMAGLGLRRAEAVAVADADVAVDAESMAGVLSVRRAYKEKTVSVGDPKSKAGRRDLPMPSWLCRDVLEWRRLRDALGFGESEWLCCNTQGGLLATQNLQRWWNKQREGLGVPGYGMHQIRHSNLSMMARYMSVFDLMRWAGWSNIEPAKVYVHSDMNAMRSALENAENNEWSGVKPRNGGASSAPLLRHLEENPGQTSV